MPTLNDYVDITPGATVTAEFDYVTVDTMEWLRATARDVSDYWLAIVERCARDDGRDERNFYSNFSTERWQYRDAGDRVVKALRKRAAESNYSEEGNLSDWTGNHESNFSDDFGYDTAPLVRDGILAGWLIFVTGVGTNGMDYGPEHVFQVDGSWEELYQVLSPEIGYYCDQDQEWAYTTNGGYTFETDDGQTRRDVIEDGQAHCSHGHAVTLSANESF